MTDEKALKPYQEKIINLMLRQETMMAELYRVFAAQFPQHAEFWNNLARDEEKHAGWLQQLYDASRNKVVLFSEGKLKTYTMETMIKGLEENLARAKAGEFDERQALSYTIDLERALIEKELFTRFTGMTEKARGVMKFLAQETNKHQDLAHELYLQGKTL